MKNKSVGIRKNLLSSFAYFVLFSLGNGLFNFGSHCLLEYETDLEGQALFAIQNGISTAFMISFLTFIVFCCMDSEKPVGRSVSFFFSLLINYFLMSAGGFTQVDTVWEGQLRHVPDTLRDANLLAYTSKISFTSGIIGLTSFMILNAIPKKDPRQTWSAIKNNENKTVIKKWGRTISTVSGGIVVIAAVDIATFFAIRASGGSSDLLYMLPKLTAAIAAGLVCYPAGNKIIARVSPAHWRILFLGSSFTIAYFLSSSGFEYYLNLACNFHNTLHRLPLALQDSSLGTYSWQALATTGGVLFTAVPLCQKAMTRINNLIEGITDSITSPLLKSPEPPISFCCCPP